MKLARRAVTHALRTLSYGVLGGLIVAIVGGVLYLDDRPDLKVWHQADLDAEFTADSDVSSFDEYLALEERLFRQLDERVYDRIAPEDRSPISRYNRNSLSDPTSNPPNWNRSFELAVASPRIGVLLIHGMSDSPYSVRSLGERVHEAGAHTIGLRVPGHGTAPSGLVDVEWQDMAAAVRIAMEHLKEKVGERPLLIVGYSNGAALAVEHALASLEDPAQIKPDGLFLLSAEIGVTKLAALAVWQERLGHLLGLEKLAWNSILPEYDPYKYGSFALNAGKQAYLITQSIQARITRLDAEGRLDDFPPMLAFQSVADATVSAPALVTGLFDRIPGEHHELVLFDINRSSDIEPILKRDPNAWLDDMLRDISRPFTVGVVANESDDSQRVVLHQQVPGDAGIRVAPLDLRWPDDLYSLSHVSLPFPPDDPIYGGPDARPGPLIQLGGVALRGERGVLEVGAADMLRLRWNPFHSYIVDRLVQAVGELESAHR